MGKDGLRFDSQLLDRVNESLGFLGSEFLVWIWYGDAMGVTYTQGGDDVDVHLADKMTLISTVVVEGGQMGKMTLNFSDPSSRREALAALKSGMLPIEACIVIKIGEMTWSLTVDNKFNFKRFHSPRMAVENGTKLDAQGTLYEAVEMMDTGESLFRRIFGAFLDERLDPVMWDIITQSIRSWVDAGSSFVPPRTGRDISIRRFYGDDGCSLYPNQYGYRLGSMNGDDDILPRAWAVDRARRLSSKDKVAEDVADVLQRWRQQMQRDGVTVTFGSPTAPSDSADKLTLPLFGDDDAADEDTDDDYDDETDATDATDDIDDIDDETAETDNEATAEDATDLDDNEIPF